MASGLVSCDNNTIPAILVLFPQNDNTISCYTKYYFFSTIILFPAILILFPLNNNTVSIKLKYFFFLTVIILLPVDNNTVVRYDGVKEISVKSPKLTFTSSQRSDIRLISHTSAIAQVRTASCYNKTISGVNSRRVSA